MGSNLFNQKQKLTLSKDVEKNDVKDAARTADIANIRFNLSQHQLESKIFLTYMRSIPDRGSKELSPRKDEAALPFWQKLFRMLVEHADNPFFIHDYFGKIIEVNRNACLALDYSREELLNLKISDIDTEMRKKRHRVRFWEPLSFGEDITFETILMRKDGMTLPVEVRIGRIDIGKQKLFLSLIRDVTERKRAENEFIKAFQNVIELTNPLEKENMRLRSEIESKYKPDMIIGESDAIKKVLHDAKKVAKEKTSILIHGETGTGKELLARAIHNMSLRQAYPMITVNCAALPHTLIESELFGREKGAFTGAVSKQIGRFEAANGSTLFLDEVSELPMELQAKLLRVLQECRFERLGSSKTISVDVRVIAATNQNLTELVREKKFRQDLYYRLNVFPITVPPLRERREDIPLLVWAFVKEFEESMGKSIANIPQKDMDLLQSYPWPGNIRELKNIIERAMILSTGRYLHIDHINRDMPTVSNKKATLKEIYRKEIIQTLKTTGWRVSGKKGAAQLLGLKESTLRSRMHKLGIKRPG